MPDRDLRPTRARGDHRDQGPADGISGVRGRTGASYGCGMQDVLGLYPGEREELLNLLRGLDADEWEAPTECPAWSVKGIALHILGDDFSLLSRQRDEAPPGVVVDGT